MTTVTDAAVIPAQREPVDDGTTNESWALVQRCQAGDTAAFGLIYERYHDRVFRFVYSKVESRALAEDLTADTFVRSFKSIGRFAWQGRDFGAWLVTVARNLVADHYKSGRYRTEVLIDGFHRDQEPLDEDQPDLLVEAVGRAVAVQGALDRIGAEQAEVLRLRFLRGLSVAATAKAMGKTDGAVKALTGRAMASMLRHNPELEAWR